MRKLGMVVVTLFVATYVHRLLQRRGRGTMSVYPFKRYALVRGNDAWLTDDVVAAYLPDNYQVVEAFDEEEQLATGLHRRTVILIEGRDEAAWTLESYVRPRLESGLMSCEEIDLTHPVMKLVES
jgi:hypothetical protein